MSNVDLNNMTDEQWEKWWDSLSHHQRTDHADFNWINNFSAPDRVAVMKVFVKTSYEEALSDVIDKIKPHLEVCNYKAVNDQECDVCAWVGHTIMTIEGMNK
jgi:hypothetical protein